MNPPTWALTLAYWLHMIATVFWLGGLAALSFLVLPTVRKTLDTEHYLGFLTGLQRRLDPLGWFSLGLLTATGLFQMSANPNYQGALTFSNPWAIAILIKHLFFLGMVGLSAFMTWGLLPQLRRIAIKQSSASSESLQTEIQAKLSRQEQYLIRLNLVLGLLILGLTAFARSLS